MRLYKSSDEPHKPMVGFGAGAGAAAAAAAAAADGSRDAGAGVSYPGNSGSGGGGWGAEPAQENNGIGEGRGWQPLWFAVSRFVLRYVRVQQMWQAVLFRARGGAGGDPSLSSVVCGRLKDRKKASVHVDFALGPPQPWKKMFLCIYSIFPKLRSLSPDAARTRESRGGVFCLSASRARHALSKQQAASTIR